jgi:hypothetical protein
VCLCVVGNQLIFKKLLVDDTKLLLLQAKDNLNVKYIRRKVQNEEKFGYRGIACKSKNY